MARTAQSARKSTGGKASRKQVAHKPARKRFLSATRTVSKAHAIEAYRAQQTNAQRLSDLEALHAVGLTEEDAGHLWQILNCTWDTVFHYFEKTEHMRTPEACMQHYKRKNILEVCKDYVREHGKPGRPYKGDPWLFACPVKQQARDKTAAAKAVKAKAKALKPKGITKAIAKKKKTQSAKKPPPKSGGGKPPSSPDAGDGGRVVANDFLDIYEQLKNVTLDARIDEPPHHLLSVKPGYEILLADLSRKFEQTCTVKAIDGVYVIIGSDSIYDKGFREWLCLDIPQHRDITDLRLTRYNVLRVISSEAW